MIDIRNVPAFVTILAVTVIPLLLGGQFADWQDLIEAGDAAANSLLVQQWRETGFLLHGNYSRIQFYHPGPFLIGFAFFGEIVLNNILHMAPSAMAGQALGFELYNLVFLTSVYICWSQLSGRMNALSGVMILIGYMRLIDPQLLGSFWFPDLYGPPFAALVVATATILSGRSIGLPVFAVAGVALVHGHVSFVLICGLPALALTILWVMKRIQLKDAYGHAFLAAIIIALGILPIGLDFILHFPGQLGSYLSYGTSGERGIGLSRAMPLLLDTVLWPSFATPWIAAASLLTAAMLSRTSCGNLLTHLLAAGITLIGVMAYLALMADAPDGYLIRFTNWISPILIALSLAVALRGRLAPSVVFIAIAVTAAGLRADRGQFYFVTAPRDSVMALRSELLKAADGRVVQLMVDLRPHDWAPNWDSILPLLLEDARNGGSNFCIDNSGWHPSFSSARRCDQEAFAGRPMIAVFPASGKMPGHAMIASDERTHYWVPYGD